MKSFNKQCKGKNTCSLTDINAKYVTKCKNPASVFYIQYSCLQYDKDIKMKKAKAMIAIGINILICILLFALYRYLRDLTDSQYHEWDL